MKPVVKPVVKPVIRRRPNRIRVLWWICARDTDPYHLHGTGHTPEEAYADWAKRCKTHARKPVVIRRVRKMW